MTASDKPEEPDSRSAEDADRTVVMTDAAEDSAGIEESAAADGGGSTEQTGAAGDGIETPPPWQRSTAAEAAGSAGSASGAGVAEDDAAESTLDAAVPRSMQDQDTVRTQLPQDQQRSSVSFDTGARSAGGAESSGGGTTATRRPNRGPRRASLQVKRVDPWSVLKLALVLSVAMFIVWMIAVAVLYGVLDGMGVWDNLNSGISDLTQADNTITEPLISAGSVFGVALIVGAINIVLVTALATVSAFIYNVAADFAGGLEVTLSERE